MTNLFCSENRLELKMQYKKMFIKWLLMFKIRNKKFSMVHMNMIIDINLKG